MPEPNIRIQKFIADCGMASRRQAEELMKLGQVKVNGRVVTEMGTRVDPQRDRVEVRGKRCEGKERKLYLKIYKPRGVVSSCRTYPHEMTIIDVVKDIKERLYPVGRLDKASEGLMLLTNDGELANQLMHPRYEHEKEYEVNVKYPMTNDKLEELRKGIELEEGKTLPAKVIRRSDTRFNIILKEGKKRQIRRMVEAVENKVVKLVRIRIKNILVGNLEPGQYKTLSPQEIKDLL